MNTIQKIIIKIIEKIVLYLHFNLNYNILNHSDYIINLLLKHGSDYIIDLINDEIDYNEYLRLYNQYLNQDTPDEEEENKESGLFLIWTIYLIISTYFTFKYNNGMDLLNIGSTLVSGNSIINLINKFLRNMFCISDNSIHREEYIYYSHLQYNAQSHWSDYSNDNTPDNTTRMYMLLRQQGLIDNYCNLPSSSHDNRVEAYGILGKKNKFKNSYLQWKEDHNVIPGPSNRIINDSDPSIYNTPLSRNRDSILTEYQTPRDRNRDSIVENPFFSANRSNFIPNPPASTSNVKTDGHYTNYKLKPVLEKIIDAWDEY
jgi:hypothetical protein